MSPDSLIVGQAYYRLGFADPDMTVPSVEPMIYLGLDVFPDQAREPGEHYFQDALSHRYCGSAAGDDFRPHAAIEPVVYTVETEQIGHELLDLDGVILALNAARQRGAARS